MLKEIEFFFPWDSAFNLWENRLHMSRKANRRKKRHRKQLNRCLFRQSWNMNILFQSTAAFLSKLNIVLRLFSETRYKIVSFAASIHDKLTANYRVCNPAFVKVSRQITKFILPIWGVLSAAKFASLEKKKVISWMLDHIDRANYRMLFMK